MALHLNFRKTALAVATATALTLPAIPSVAQTSSEGGQAMLEEVVVTARRKQESLQDVPTAITALDGEYIERMRLTAVEDLRSFVPGVNVSGLSRDTANFYIRGQGQVNGTTGARNESGITQYFAEVPIAQAGPGVFYDLQNVQVLKGPQGILFGRNTTGGAVLFEPNAPEFANYGSIEAQVGNYGLTQFNVVGNFVAVPDTLAVRVAGEFVERDGFTQSIITGQEKDNRDYDAMRASFLFTPGERFENQLILDYRETKSNGAGLVMTALNANQPFGIIPMGAEVAGVLSLITGQQVAPGFLPLTAGGSNVSVACLQAPLPGCPDPIFGSGALGAYAAAYAQGGFYLIQPNTVYNSIIDTQNRIGPRKNQSPFMTQLDRESFGVVNKTNFQLSDNVLIRNIISYRENKELQALDFSGIPLPYIQIFGPAFPDEEWTGGMELFTEEIQVQAQLNDSMSLIVGAYYETSEPGNAQSTTGVLFGAPSIRAFDYDDESKAVFGHIEWTVSDQLGLAAGVRRTWDTREMSPSTFAPDGSCSQVNPFTGLTACPVTGKEDFSATTFDVSASWTPSEDLLVYASFRRGYRAGGLNVPAFPAPPPLPQDEYASYDPEFVDDIELGVKWDFNLGSAPARLNAAFFWDDFTDIQVSNTVNYLDANGNIRAASVYRNVAEAEIKGVEAELTVQPVDGLVIGLWGSYLDAAPKDDYFDEGGTQRVMGGRQMQNQPQTKYGANVSYTRAVGANGTIIASANYAWQDSWFSTTMPSIGDPNDSYGLLNARLSWESVMGSNFDLSVWGTNLTDETYELGGYPIDSLGFASSVYGEPRMYGASIKYSFGSQ